MSVVTFGEIREGIEKARTTDLTQALALERWLETLHAKFKEQTLPVTLAIAEQWGRLISTGRLPENDGWIAATALHHGLTLVTRNVKDFERSGVRVLNPFSA